jgi:quercetin dioxygenase-like cupin family protein
MQKLILADIADIPAAHPDLSGVTVKSVIDPTTVNAPRGMLSIATFAPGGFHQLHRHPASAQIYYLVSGRGEHLTENGPVSVRAGDATYAPVNAWHGFRNTGSEKAVLLSLYSPATQLSEAGYESYAGEIDTTTAPRLAKVSLADLRGDAALDENAGFIGLGVYWLATRDTVGTESFLLGASSFEPGGVHEHHRHVKGDEFLYILEGGGEHLTLDGVVPLSAGEIAYIPANEYHAFKNPDGVMTRTLFGYFGAATLAEAGYEVRDSPSA